MTATLVGSDKVSPSASRNLEAYLLALNGSRDELLVRWHSLRAKTEEMNRIYEQYNADREGHGELFEKWNLWTFSERPGSYRNALLDCFCHVDIADKQVLDSLIEMIEIPRWLFGRYD